MDVKIENQESCMVLALGGRFDADVALRFGERVDFEIEKKAGDKTIDFDLIVDMEQVTYISSGGIRVFLSLHEKMRDTGGILALCNLQTLVARVINVAGLFAVFNIYASVGDARDRIAKGQG